MDHALAVAAALRVRPEIAVQAIPDDPRVRAPAYEDVYTKIDLCRAHHRDAGLPADCVDRFIR